ncbi:hypothetical protein [Rahnella aceris]
MKKLIPAIIAAALLSGCATQNDAVALSNRISDQQKQINALSVRLQSAEHRLSQQESAFRSEQTLLLPERRQILSGIGVRWPYL